MVNIENNNLFLLDNPFTGHNPVTVQIIKDGLISDEKVLSVNALDNTKLDVVAGLFDNLGIHTLLLKDVVTNEQKTIVVNVTKLSDSYVDSNPCGCGNVCDNSCGRNTSTTIIKEFVSSQNSINKEIKGDIKDFDSRLCGVEKELDDEWLKINDRFKSFDKDLELINGDKLNKDIFDNFKELIDVKLETINATDKSLKEKIKDYCDLAEIVKYWEKEFNKLIALPSEFNSLEKDLKNLQDAIPNLTILESKINKLNIENTSRAEKISKLISENRKANADVLGTLSENLAKIEDIKLKIFDVDNLKELFDDKVLEDNDKFRDIEKEFKILSSQICKLDFKDRIDELEKDYHKLDSALQVVEDRLDVIEDDLCAIKKQLKTIQDTQKIDHDLITKLKVAGFDELTPEQLVKWVNHVKVLP